MFIYSTHKTYEAAREALEYYFADGEVFEGELYGDWIMKIKGRWCIVLKLNGNI